MKATSQQRLVVLLLLLISLTILASFGLILIEDEQDWSFLDAFYFILITITTIGFGEIHPLSDEGRLFVIGVIIIGVGLTAYTISTTIEVIIEGKLKDFYSKSRMNKMIKNIKDHYLICGFGRIGMSLCEGLEAIGAKFIVVESNPEKISALEEKNYLFIMGNANDEDVLIEAGLKKAKVIISMLGRDTFNLFITLTARILNPSILIFACYEFPKTKRKLIRAGADATFSPYAITGHEILKELFSLLMLDTEQPHDASSTDQKGIQKNEDEFNIGHIIISEHSQFKNKQLKESKIREDYQVNIIGIIDENNKTKQYNPTPDHKLLENQKLIVIGKIKNIKKLQKNVVK